MSNTKTTREVIVVTDSLKARFSAKTIKADSGCIIWTGAVSRNGYGKFRLPDGPQDAHVVAWRLANGGISVPVGSLIMHACDCRLCVNPEHLSTGTSSDNMTDAHRDGRGEEFVSRGEDRPNAVLTEALVISLRAEYASGSISGRKLAEKHGISYEAVKSMLQRKTWKHVVASLQSVGGGK